MTTRAKGLLVAVVIALALVTLDASVRADGDDFVYEPTPCEQLPWWLILVRTDCWL